MTKQINYPSMLPITGQKDLIIKAIRENQVIIVAGDTGSVVSAMSSAGEQAAATNTSMTASPTSRTHRILISDMYVFLLVGTGLFWSVPI